uniref:Uncharacterized protein n=1 Tax=Medicago truncatula TaxID=3880 RepID=A2Q4K3_MEDTR|nr:hypothetical protein MtrDRAFT_AC157502g4v2 [Medicago truncatula]
MIQIICEVLKINLDPPPNLIFDLFHDLILRLFFVNEKPVIMFQPSISSASQPNSNEAVVCVLLERVKVA